MIKNWQKQGMKNMVILISIEPSSFQYTYYNYPKKTGFHRTFFTQVGCSFLFYCQQVIKIFLTVRIMAHQHPRKEDIPNFNFILQETSKT